MGSSDFYVDFNIEVDNITDAFAKEAERRLRAMAEGHRDIVGASVALEKAVKAETAFLYEVRIVLFMKPQYLRVSEQHADPMAALRAGLEALEGRVLKAREKLRENSIPRSETTNNVVYDLSAQEVYATYAKGIKPSEMLKKDRTEIASKLMLEDGLSEEAAYFAADQIMRVAVENTEGRE